MLSANELRIGNYVHSIPQQKVFQVSIKTLRNFKSGRCYIEPILITEEWLLKLGFKLALNGYWCPIDLINVKLSKHKVIEIYLSGSDTDLAFNGIQYINQLQNLYLCLCGKELEIC
jgi:hypothetical protein